MAAAYATLSRAASTRTTVLLTGESGVGKEVAARFVHDHSGCEGRLVAVNCAALCATLLESELFGHEHGAFTGAVARRPGKFEQADGGTLFLDEIGEMPMALQPKLLRVLQDGEVTRVGGLQPVRTRVRVVVATNRDLSRMVAQGLFRADLYYRLNVIAIRLPALRERRADIPDLVVSLLHSACVRQGRPPMEITPGAMALLEGHDWPGNIRELSNVIERAVVLCRGGRIDVADLVDGLQGGPSMEPATSNAVGVPPGTLAEALELHRSQLVAATLRHYDGNQARAAAHLGVHPSNFSRMLKRMGLR